MKNQISNQLNELKQIAEGLRKQNLPVVQKIGKKKFAKSSYAAGYNAGLDFMTNQINHILKGENLHQLENLDEKGMKLYQTNGDIEWYKINDKSYEGFNKKNESWEYTLHKDISGFWILRGQGKDATGQFRHDLMESVSKV